MADVTEKFNVEEVKNKMNTLETAFNALSDALSEANKIVNEEVNVGPESALFGELGTILLNTWNENASTFGDFHANFESWAQVVSVIAANNMSFTEETIKAYKDDGSTLTYKDDTTGERKSISSLREEKAQEQTINYVKNNFPEDKYDITESDNSLVIKDKNGNIVVEYSMENGKITSTKWYDSDGNYSVITYEVGEDGKLKKNVTYYDANGNVIEKPSSFYEDGTLRPDLTGSSGDESTEVVPKTGNLSDLKDGDTVTIGTEECVVSEKNGVRTITLKNGEQIQIMSDGTVKTLYGGEVEINGQKIGSTAYTDEELRSYYAELNKGKSNYSYKNAEGQNVDVNFYNDSNCTEYVTNLENGDYVREIHYHDDVQVAKFSVENGVATLTFINKDGQELFPSDKTVRTWLGDEVTSINYVGKDGHNKVMTRDSSTGGYVVEDKANGDSTYYFNDANGNSVAKTISNGEVTIKITDASGQDVKTTYKDVTKYLDENCTSIKYIGQNGHEKTMTKDSNIDCFVVKDGDEVTYYDTNLKQKYIDYTVLDESTGKCQYVIHSGNNSATDTGTVVKTVENGKVWLQFKDVFGNETTAKYKDAAQYFDQNCTSLTYMGKNSHLKTMTKDPSTGCFAVRDSNGTLTCYDANLKEIDIADTSFNEDGSIKQ